MVGQALINTLEKGLGKLWTPEVKAAWADVYTTVSATMKAGAKELPEVQAQPAAQETPVQLVQRTWAVVAADPEGNGVALFRGAAMPASMAQPGCPLCARHCCSPA